MNTERRTTVLAAAFGASAILVLSLAMPASAGPASTEASSFQTTQVSPDGFSVRSTEEISPDGFSVRTTEPAPKQVALASIKKVSPDGFSVRSTGPMPLDGWAVASVELPRETAMLDGWAAGSGRETTLASGIDGWSYSAVSGDLPASIASTDAVTGATSSTPTYELVGILAMLAAAAIAGVMFEIHGRRSHLPI